MISNKSSLNNQTIYQVFVRQFSPTHDFNGVTAQLGRIKDLGADILYLMPLYPIGERGRKGSVGSPYSIRDYSRIDPLNGTKEDFINLLSMAHSLGLKVIIDMVLNHTSRDSVLLQNHEEWFYHRDGEAVSKVADWSDVCDLDYSHKELCDEITEMLCGWVKLGVDGFRMDVCSLVPAHFWAQAVGELHKINPDVIMFGESIEIDFVRSMRRIGCNAMSDGEAYNYFDILYCYDIHDSQSGFLERKGGTLAAWIKEVKRQEGAYPVNYVKARYLDNHDRERIAKFWQGGKLKVLWALNFYLKGTAFVYAGDETSADKANNLFEIDGNEWRFGDKDADISGYIANLAGIKKHGIYSCGYFDASMAADNTAVLSYESGDALSIGIFNLADGSVSAAVPLADGEYENLVTHTPVTVNGGRICAGEEAIIIEIKR